MFSPTLRVLLAGSALGLAAAAQATTVTLVSSTTQGFYNSSIGDLGAPDGNLPWFPAPLTFGGPQDEVFASEPDLSGGAAALGDWLTDPANLNANWSGLQAIPVNWLVNTEVAIVYVIEAGPGLKDITASFIGIDNGIHIWVDGQWQFGARDPEGRGWLDIPLGDTGPGTRYIQILLEDSGGAQLYFQPNITATVVPLPAAGWLLLTGAGLLGARRLVRA